MDNLYQQLLNIYASQIDQANSEQWEVFLETDKQRQRLLDVIKNNSSEVADITVINQLQEYNQELQNLTNEQQETIKQALIDLRKQQKNTDAYAKNRKL